MAVHKVDRVCIYCDDTKGGAGTDSCYDHYSYDDATNELVVVQVSATSDARHPGSRSESTGPKRRIPIAEAPESILAEMKTKGLIRDANGEGRP